MGFVYLPPRRKRLDEICDSDDSNGTFIYFAFDGSVSGVVEAQLATGSDHEKTIIPPNLPYGIPQSVAEKITEKVFTSPPGILPQPVDGLKPIPPRPANYAPSSQELQLYYNLKVAFGQQFAKFSTLSKPSHCARA